MNRADARLFLGCLLAVSVPAAVLHATTPEPRRAAGLTAPPFAWPRLMVAHLALVLPLGLFVARWLLSSGAIKASHRGACALAGVAAAGFAAPVAPEIGDVIRGSEFGAAPLLALRASLALVLVLPWCIAALDAPAPTSHPQITFALGLALALIPPALYTDAVAAARTEQVNELLARERLARGLPVLTGLCELGSARAVASKPPGDVRRLLTAHVEKLRKVAERPIAPSAPFRAKVERATLLVQIDRLDEAAALLEPFAPANVIATLLLATVYRDQERWAASDAMFAAALERLSPLAATDPGARAACVSALEGLAFNARADARPGDAERALARGLESFPTEAAFFHYQLGKHYHDGGRPARALEHLDAATRIDPAKYSGPAEKLARSIRTATPACLPRRSN